MNSSRALLLVAACTVVLASCGDEGSRPTEILCSTAYRVSTSEELTSTDTVTFPDEPATQAIPYIYLEFHAEYSPGFDDNERSLRVWVTPTASEQVLVTHLYQLPTDEGPTDQFVGGHGFTGLNYVYDPVSGAELQYWCEAG